MQSDGINTLVRIELEYKEKTYEFSINPQDLSVSYKNRAGVTQTLGGHWVDKFGQGLPEITFSGITGYKLGSDAEEGYRKYKELKEIVLEAFNTENNLRSNENVEPMRFYNFTDEEYWEIIPIDFSVQRSSSNPLMFRYSFRCYGIKDMNNSDNSSRILHNGGILDGVLGEDIEHAKFSVLDGIKEKFETLRNSKNFANWQKERPVFSSVIGSAIKASNSNVSFRNGKISVSSNIEALGVKVPFYLNSEGESSIRVSVEDTGTIMDGLSLLTGTSGTGEISPLAYSYSSSGMSLSGSFTKKSKQPEELKEYISEDRFLDFNLKPENLEELVSRVSTNNYGDFDFETYNSKGKSSENFSVILSENYQKSDSVLHYSISKVETYLEPSLKKELLYVLLCSISITSDILKGLSGSALRCSEGTIKNQIVIIESLLDDLRDKDIPELLILITSLEALNSMYRSLIKIQLFGRDN